MGFERDVLTNEWGGVGVDEGVGECVDGEPAAGRVGAGGAGVGGGFEWEEVGVEVAEVWES